MKAALNIQADISEISTIDIMAKGSGTLEGTRVQVYDSLAGEWRTVWEGSLLCSHNTLGGDPPRFDFIGHGPRIESSNAG